MPRPDAVIINDLPITTFVGTKYHETVSVTRLTRGRRGRPGGCDTCPYLPGCLYDVIVRDGFAWCEDLIPLDLDPGNGKGESFERDVDPL